MCSYAIYGLFVRQEGQIIRLWSIIIEITFSSAEVIRIMYGIYWYVCDEIALSRSNQSKAMDSSKPLVLVKSLRMDGPDGSWIKPEYEKALREYFEIVCLVDTERDPSLLADVRGLLLFCVDALIIPDILPMMHQLEAIVVTGSGYDYYYDACKPFGIPIANTPYPDASADFTMSLVLAAGCHVMQGVSVVMGKSPPRTMSCGELQRIPGVGGKTMGIVGMGRIGFEVARRAQVFNMTILYHNRNKRSIADEQLVGAEYYDVMDDMLPRCDYVVILCPLSPQTRALIGRQQLSLMKKSAILVNVSRGHVIEQDALVEALSLKTICYAALDVTYPEPLPQDHPLRQLDNVLLTPHFAGFCGHIAWDKMCQYAIDNLKAALIEHTTMPYVIKE